MEAAFTRPTDRRKSLLNWKKMRLGERLVAHFVEILPVVLRVLTHPGLDDTRMKDWHARLPFPRLVQALTEELRGLEADGLIGDVEPTAAARSFVASMLSTALFESFTTLLPLTKRAERIATLVDVIWTGLGVTQNSRTGA